MAMAASRSCASAAASSSGDIRPSSSLRVAAGPGTTVPGMATKRQPSKQRRQNQNRNNRVALEKRRQNIESGKVPAGQAAGATEAPAKKTSVLGRLTGTGGS